MAKGNKFAEEHKREPIEALTYTQSEYITAINEPVKDNGDDAYVMAIGPAGTGKTWIASMIAADLYLQKEYQQIIIARPTISCGDQLGALPGTLEEKYEPWVAEVVKPLQKRIGKSKFECDFGKNIHAVPLQFMRGETYDNAIIIIDEAQNTTDEQMEMATTRIGLNSKMIICGDLEQNDHKFNYKRQEKESSGLEILVNELRRQETTGIEIIKFKQEDCVRSDACKKMLVVHSRKKKDPR